MQCCSVCGSNEPVRLSRFVSRRTTCIVTGSVAQPVSFESRRLRSASCHTCCSVQPACACNALGCICANSCGVHYASTSRDVRAANTNGERRVSTQAWPPLLRQKLSSLRLRPLCGTWPTTAVFAALALAVEFTLLSPVVELITLVPTITCNSAHALGERPVASGSGTHRAAPVVEFIATAPSVWSSILFVSPAMDSSWYFSSPRWRPHEATPSPTAEFIPPTSACRAAEGHRASAHRSC